MKLFPNLFQAAVHALEKCFSTETPADILVDQLLRGNPKWGSRDRRTLAYCIYDVIRYRRLFGALAGTEGSYNKTNLSGVVRAWAVIREVGLPPDMQPDDQEKEALSKKFEELLLIRKYRESIPDWLDDLGEESLGDTLWNAELEALNKPADVVIRANTLLTDRERLADILGKSGVNVKTIPDCPDGLVIEKRTRLTQTKAYKKGLFEFMDAASQQVAPYLHPKPGQFVIDACAGAGGKTLHLASLMEDSGEILAFDVKRSKLQELERRVRRNRAHIVKTKRIRKQEDLSHLEGRADRVLIDAPCSGLGILRRKPDTKWYLNKELLAHLLSLQAEILKTYTAMVKPGGFVVYATCSILPAENEEQVDAFLQSPPGQTFEKLSQQTLYASSFGYDGFYMALLRRK